MTENELLTHIKTVDEDLRRESLEKRFKGKAQRLAGFANKNFSGNEIRTLAHSAEVLLKGTRGLDAFVINERMFVARNWDTVLATTVWYCTNRLPDRALAIAKLGYLSWIHSRVEGIRLDRVEAMRKGLVELHCRDTLDMIRKTQWLLLVFEISLADVGVSYQGAGVKSDREAKPKEYTPYWSSSTETHDTDAALAYKGGKKKKKNRGPVSVKNVSLPSKHRSAPSPKGTVHQEDAAPRMCFVNGVWTSVEDTF